MSFQELSITISAVNLASAEFSRIAEDAAHVKAEVEASPIRVEFEPITVPPIPPVDVSSVAEAGRVFSTVQTEAGEMAGEVRASASAFTEMSAQAEASTISLRTAAAAFGSVARMGSAMISLAGELGLVDKETAKWARTMFYAFSIAGSLVRVQHYLTVLTTGHSAAIVVNTTVQNANAGSSLAVAAAHKVKAAATWMATAAQNALNISHAAFLALTGVGIGVIIAAAAAMSYFASQMRAATSSLKEYNAAAAEMPTASRKIIRTGELDALSLLRRGVEP